MFYYHKLVLSILELYINGILQNVLFLPGFFVSAQYFCDSLFVVYIKSLFVFIAELHFVVWIYHNFFICGTFVGHLGCFQFGAIMNKVSVLIFAQIFCRYIFWFPLSKCLGVALLCHRVYVYSMRNYQTFPKWLHHFTVNQQCVRALQSACSISSPMFSSDCLLNFKPSSELF